MDHEDNQHNEDDELDQGKEGEESDEQDHNLYDQMQCPSSLRPVGHIATSKNSDAPQSKHDNLV